MSAIAQFNADGTTAGGVSTRATGTAKTVIDAAQQWIGTTYAWGGGDAAGPSRGIHDGGVADSYQDYTKIGFDCSGLTLYAYAQVGISLPHSAAAQAQMGQQIPASTGSAALQPGDLVFWAWIPSARSTVHHVGIYIGNGQMINAPYSGTTVRIDEVTLSGVRRSGTTAMSRGIALIAAAAVLIATAITLWLSAGASPTSRPTATGPTPRMAASPSSAAQPTTPVPSKTASSTTPPSTPKATPDITAPPAAEAQQLSDPSMQALLDQTVPSTVTGSTAQEVITIATAVQLADLSGVGREKWPTYFGNEPPTDEYRDVHIHAATARWKGAGKGFVVVTLMWSATAPAGTPTSVVTIAITLAWNGAHWIPVHTTAS